MRVGADRCRRVKCLKGELPRFRSIYVPSGLLAHGLHSSRSAGKDTTEGRANDRLEDLPPDDEYAEMSLENFMSKV